MDDRRTSSFKIWAVALALLLGMGATYTFAYFVASTTTTRNIVTGGTCRVYRSMWVAMLFLPAALVESAATGTDVSPAWTDAGS